MDKKDKVKGRIGIFVDTIKGMLIVTVAVTLIVIFASLIIHNILRFTEVSSEYTGEYKDLYPVKDKMMNVYKIGEGEKTIVILPGFGVQSPVLEYKALADSLSDEYKVVIIEYLGSGFSLTTDDERSNKEMANEIVSALVSGGINGPYILMPFSISNIYAMYINEQYPSDITGIISVDGMYPEEIENKNFKNEYLPSLKSNVKFYSGVAFTGLFRWQSYLQPEKFNIDDLINNSSYGISEVKLYRNLLANKFLTKPMVNEINKLEDNMLEMKDYKYPESLNTLQILTKNTISEYSTRGEDIQKFAENIITNSNTQHIKELSGDVSEYLFNDNKTLKQLIELQF